VPILRKNVRKHERKKKDTTYPPRSDRVNLAIKSNKKPGVIIGNTLQISVTIILPKTLSLP